MIVQLNDTAANTDVVVRYTLTSLACGGFHGFLDENNAYSRRVRRQRHRQTVVCADHHCDLLFEIKSQGPSWLFPLGSDLPCLVPEINQDGQSKGKAVHYGVHRRPICTTPY